MSTQQWTRQPVIPQASASVARKNRRSCSFLALPLPCKTVGLGWPIAALASVAREFLANGRLAGPDGLHE